MPKVNETSHVHFERRTNPRQLASVILTDFISGASSLKPKYPVNYPYSIYSAWEATTLPFSVDHEEEHKDKKRRALFWWQPDQDSIPAQFLESSSMHGLKYISQPRRHIVERLFWLISFIASLTGATIMIMEIWQRYYANPVIVTFNPTEQEVASIPFPAITICNTNPFKRQRVERYSLQYKNGATKRERDEALDALRVINAICSTQQSFLKAWNYAPRRGEIMGIPEAKDNPSVELEMNLTDFLLRNSQPCRELLRICIWGQEKIDCEKLFKPIITDYGKCCTFNMLPQQLMEHYISPTSQTIYGDDPQMKKSAWTDQDLKDWASWNYDDNGYVVPSEKKYPYRQRRAGTVDGLSVLLDPDLDNSFCPSTDSLGIKILYHVPLDAPRVADLGLVIGTDREVFMEINPDLTIADDGIISYSHETRKCYFGNEFKLSFYKPYTRSNCMEECWSEIMLKNCKCVLYYTPRNSNTSVCSTNKNSVEYQCVKVNEQKFIGIIGSVCSYCKYSCNDLNYNAEVTYAQLQPYEELWANGINTTKEEWMHHKISIVHIFMGSDSTVPKLRQKLYQTVDLIANTGGLLGLSIGFSVLSAVEIIYFATMRICCKRLRKHKRFGQDGARHSEHDVTKNEHSNENSNTQQDNGLNRLPLISNGKFLQELNSQQIVKLNNSNLGGRKWC